jgi:hypothetical protein
MRKLSDTPQNQLETSIIKEDPKEEETEPLFSLSPEIGQ